MRKELIIRSKSSSVDFALLKDGKLIEFQKEVGTNKFHVGDIFLAVNISPATNPLAFTTDIVSCVAE